MPTAADPPPGPSDADIDRLADRLADRVLAPVLAAFEKLTAAADAQRAQTAARPAALLRRREAAAYLGCNVDKFDDLARGGHVPAGVGFAPGGNEARLWKRIDLDRCVDKLKLRRPKRNKEEPE